MEIAKLQAMPSAEVSSELNRQREELRQLRFKTHQGQLKNLRQIREIKKNIAIILTFLHRKKNP